jgi:hypothetical protein
MELTAARRRSSVLVVAVLAVLATAPGAYHLTKLPAGRYTLSFTPTCGTAGSPGQYPLQGAQTLTVSPEATNTVNAALTASQTHWAARRVLTHRRFATMARAFEMRNSHSTARVSDHRLTQRRQGFDQ